MSQDLQTIHDDLKKAVAIAAKRRSRTQIILTALALFMAAYLGFAYSQFAKVDAPTLVALAEAQALPVLNQPASEWAGYLEDQAPGLIDQAGNLTQTLPEIAEDHLTNYVDQRIAKEMPRLEAKLTELITRMLDIAEEHIKEHSQDGTFTDEEAQAVIDQVIAQFEESLEVEFNKIYEDYSQIAEQIVIYLDKLATQPAALTQTELLHRDIIISLIALIEQSGMKSPVEAILPQ